MSFFAAFAAILPRSAYISPDIGRRFSSQGCVDFYVNSMYKWGEELLRRGANAQEYIARFGASGIYRQIQFSDYAVIDFRPTPVILMADDSSLIDVGLWIIEYAREFITLTIYSRASPADKQCNFMLKISPYNKLAKLFTQAVHDFFQ
jgi:hypothetical protein